MNKKMPSEEIKLWEIFPQLQGMEANYVVHLAIKEPDSEPLDVFRNSFKDWRWWNSYKGKPGTPRKGEFRDICSRKYIFSLIYTEENTWLFGGIYAQKGR